MSNAPQASSDFAQNAKTEGRIEATRKAGWRQTSIFADIERARIHTPGFISFQDLVGFRKLVPAVPPLEDRKKKEG
jgi:hypothetical protein